MFLKCRKCIFLVNRLLQRFREIKVNHQAVITVGVKGEAFHRELNCVHLKTLLMQLNCLLQ